MKQMKQTEWMLPRHYSLGPEQNISACSRSSNACQCGFKAGNLTGADRLSVNSAAANLSECWRAEVAVSCQPARRSPPKECSATRSWILPSRPIFAQVFSWLLLAGINLNPTVRQPLAVKQQSELVLPGIWKHALVDSKQDLHLHKAIRKTKPLSL